MNHSSSKPMYEQIFEELRERIEQGSYQVGERVPSEKELCDEFGVSRITSKKALEMLAADDYIVRKPGRGSFVSDAKPQRQSHPLNHSSSIHSTHLGRSKENNKGQLIGLVITNFSDMYGTELLYGLEEASRENGAFLVVRRSFGIAEQEEQIIREMLELGVDRLIIFPAQGEYFSAEILKLVIEKFPFVMVDRYLKGIPASSVSTDNVKAAKEGAIHLFELGHRDIAFLTTPPVNTTAIEERIEGIVEAHAEYGILVNREQWLESFVSTMPNVFDPEARVQDAEMLVDHLKRHPQITALFAAEYNIALLAEAAAAKLGLRIPEDLSIICFDSPKSSDSFRFTHIRQDQFEMGKQACEMVLDMNRNESPVNRILLPATLVKGRSTGPVRTSPASS
ncbi:GntR family transcriptional regulator [Gorillibacterium timonense]|uniref:GntR family transcriptional regulator n=1 Tax=Gorillibacterium timonense TaxID=1689269 RepID=UPI00292A4015|nr:GntR family transcriptional regulator [Gorillibacterium timonense]